MTRTEELAARGVQHRPDLPGPALRAVHIGTDLWGPDPTPRSPFRPARTEVARRVRALASALAGIGDPQTVVTSLRRRRTTGPVPDDVRLLTVASRRPDDLSPLRSLPLVLGLASWADVVHLHLGRPGLLGSAVAILRTARVPVVVHLHASVAHPLRSGETASFTGRVVHAALEGHVLSSADVVVAPNHRLAEVAQASGARVEVVPPAPLPVAVPDPLPPLAEVGAGRRVVSVGPLTWRRQPESLVRALARQPPDTHLFLLGTGPRRREVDREVRRWRLEGRVHVVPTLTWQVVTDHLAHADVVTTAALSGDDATVPLLATSLGRPVVATAIEGLPDLVSDGLDGRLVPPGDDEALAGALREVLTSPDVGEALGAAGQRRRAARTWQTHAERVRTLTAPLLAPGSSVGGPSGRP